MGESFKEMREQLRDNGVLTKRAKYLISLFNNDKTKFPVKIRMLGFGDRVIDSREILMGHIDEILVILNYVLKKKENE
jgi:hypothetical protein